MPMRPNPPVLWARSLCLPVGSKIDDLAEGCIAPDKVIQADDTRKLRGVVSSSAEALPIATGAGYEQHRTSVVEHMGAHVGRDLGCHGPPHSAGVCAPFDLLHVRHDGVRFSGVDGPPRE